MVLVHQIEPMRHRGTRRGQAAEFAQQLWQNRTRHVFQHPPGKNEIHAGGWQAAFGRAPTADEKAKALEFLAANSLPRLCLLMFNMSEFLYVD